MSDTDGSVDAGNPEAPTPVAEAPAQAPAQAGWMDGIENNETRAWAEAKGLHNGSLDNVLGSYHNLEKLLGADKAGRTVELLGDDATPEQTNAFYGRLGRPDEPAGYGLAAPEGEDGSFAEWASNTFHEAGLTNKQSAFLAEKWQGYVGDRVQSTADAEAISAADATAELQKEWGAAYDLKIAGIDVAANKLGFTEDQLSGLRDSMGPVEALKFVDNLNTQMGDHTYESGAADTSGVMTPEQAQNAMSELLGNKEFNEAWMDRNHPGHKAAVAKKSDLHRLISGIAA